MTKLLAAVGDSNQVRGAGVFTNMLLGGPLAPGNVDLGFVPQFYARPGITLDIAYWSQRLRGLRADVVYVNLGINDTGALVNYDGRIDQFLALLPSVPVFWPGYPIDIEPVAKQDGVHKVNHAWAMAAQRHPNLHIVPWGALANSHPEWMDRSDPVEKQVHYTPDGYEALAGLVIAALIGVA